MLAEQLKAALQPLIQTGSDWEVSLQKIRGQEYRIFTNHPQHLRAYFEKYTQLFGDQTFMVYDGQSYNFSQTWQMASALGHQLKNRYNISKGDRVAVSMRNYPEWVFAYMATVSIGAVVVPMNSWWVQREMRYGLTDSSSKLLICDEERYLRIQPDLAELKLDCIGVRMSKAYDQVQDIAALIEQAQGEPMPDVHIDPEDDASIMYTSGTTGFPKGALATHRSVTSAIQSLVFVAVSGAFLTQADPADAEQQQAILLTVPLFHVTGCLAIMLACFCVGRKMVMMYKWDALEALKLIESEKITAFTGVPTMVWEMMKHPDFEQFDVSTLGTVGGGGAPAPVTQVREVAEKFPGGQPGIGYGLTETNAITSINSGDFYLAKPKSCGLPAYLGDVKIIDPEGQSLPHNQEGEVCIRGPFVIKAYWNKPEATAESIQDGWFRSGDIGYLDEDGFLYISDRAKDMILRGGENVYCAEVESAIYEHPATFEASVFGVPDDRLGEKVAVAIMAKQGSQINEEELRAFLKEQLAHFKVPEFIFQYQEQLPRNASGKILRRELRTRAISDLGLKESS